ncbi:MAG: dihydrolipoyl dehydrogenase family protein [Parvularculaceae bacterium]
MSGQNYDVDLCVIGGGSGGLSVVAGAAQLGRKCVLIEKGKMGGDCLNYGCVPSKALLAAGAAAQNARDAAKFGVTAEPTVDFKKAMAHVRGVIASIAPHDSQERFEGLGAIVLRDHARFTGPREVKAGDATVRAKHFVIATGSSPVVPPIDGLQDVPYFTNETLFDNDELPRRLIVLGGGAIGVEMAQAHARLGAEVVLVEGATILGREDPEAVELVRERLKSEGVEVVENAFADKVAKAADGGVEITLKSGDVVRGSHLLVAVGRRANAADLGLEAAGVETDKKGIVVDDRLRTANKRVYAIGDVAGGAQFTHVAGDHASTIVRNVLFKAPAKRRDHLAPHVTYCDPELAQVGLTEADARDKHGDDVSVARWAIEENDRAKAERREDGFIKVVTDKKGRILGVTVVGKAAGDEIGMWAYALANGEKIRSVTNMIAPYPTRSEISKRAASAYYTPTLFSDRTRTLVKALAVFD